MRRPDFDDASLFDERHLVAVHCFFQVVGGKKHRHVEFCAQAFDEAPDVAAVGDVQPDGGFIQEQDLRAVDHAARDVERTALASGKLAHRLIAFFLQAEEFKQLAGALVDLSDRKVVQQSGETQVFRD